MDYDLKNDMEDMRKLENVNQSGLTALEPWNTIPSPLAWAENITGTGPYKPSDPNYFYVGDDPDYKNGNQYTEYAFFYWDAGFPSEENSPVHVAKDYMMQIQWSYDGIHWAYINAPSNDYGLIPVLYSNVMEDIPAYAFPYSDSAVELQVRLRTIHKDFLTSEPDLEGDYMYDRSLVSEWSTNRDGYVGTYYNFWGFGQPQPEPKSNGDWTDADTNDVIDNQILVTVEFPTSVIGPSTYSFTYEISNLTGTYNQVYSNNSPTFLGIGKHKMMAVGFFGGEISVHARREHIVTHSTIYASKTINYGYGEKELNISFLESDFW